MKRDGYYIGLRKETDEIGIFTSKVKLARFLGVSTDTVSRDLKDSVLVKKKRYTIWSGISIVRGDQRGGF